MHRAQNYYHYYNLYAHAMCQNIISSDTCHVSQKVLNYYYFVMKKYYLL